MKKEELLRKKAKMLQTIEGVKSNVKAGEATIKSLKKEVEELDAELKKLSGRAKYEETYYFITYSAYGAIVTWETESYDGIDDARFNSGNYWLEEDECQRGAEYTNFRMKAKKWMRENDPDFKPDWTDKETLKFFIYYCEGDNNFLIGRTRWLYTSGVHYFSSLEIAEKFRDEFADELKRGY